MASTITRITGSVPEGRTSTRPSPPHGLFLLRGLPAARGRTPAKWRRRSPVVDAHVLQQLGIGLETLNPPERLGNILWSAPGKTGAMPLETAISRQTVVVAEDVAGLLTAQLGTATDHFSA